MLHIAQTIKNKSTKKLYLYLGIDLDNEGRVHLVNENGELVMVENDTFWENYYHITDKEGKIQPGASYLPIFLGVMPFFEGMKPDMELKKLV
jgi:hypothetical protein